MVAIKSPFRNMEGIDPLFRGGESSGLNEDTLGIVGDLGKIVARYSVADSMVRDSKTLRAEARGDLERVKQPIYPEEGRLFVLLSVDESFPLPVYSSRFVDKGCRSGSLSDVYTGPAIRDENSRRLIFIADRFDIKVPASGSYLEDSGSYYYSFSFDGVHPDFIPRAEIDMSNGAGEKFIVFEAPIEEVVGWMDNDQVSVIGFGQSEIRHFMDHIEKKVGVV